MELRSILKRTCEPIPQAAIVPPRYKDLGGLYLADLLRCYGPASKNPFSHQFVVAQLRAAVHAAEAGMPCAIDSKATADKYRAEVRKFIREKIDSANAATQPQASGEVRVTMTHFYDDPEPLHYVLCDSETEAGEKMLLDEFVDCKLPRNFLVEKGDFFKKQIMAGRLAKIPFLAMYVQDKAHKQRRVVNRMPVHGPPVQTSTAAEEASRALRSTRGTTLRCEEDIERYDWDREIEIAALEKREPIRPRKRSAQGEEGRAPLKRQRVEGGSDNEEKEGTQKLEARDETQAHVTQGQASSSRCSLEAHAIEGGAPRRRPSSIASAISNQPYFAYLRRAAATYDQRSKLARRQAAASKGKGIQPPQ